MIARMLLEKQGDDLYNALSSARLALDELERTVARVLRDQAPEEPARIWDDDARDAMERRAHLNVPWPADPGDKSHVAPAIGLPPLITDLRWYRMTDEIAFEREWHVRATSEDDAVRIVEAGDLDPVSEVQVDNGSTFDVAEMDPADVDPSLL